MVLALGLLWWWPPTPKPPPLSCCCCPCCRPARPMAVPALPAAAAAACCRPCRCWTAAVGNSSSSPRLSILRARRMRPHRLFLRRMRLMPSWSTIWSAVSLGAAPFLPFLPLLPPPLPLPSLPPPPKPFPPPAASMVLPVILDRNKNPPLPRACCNVKPGSDNLAMTARSMRGSDLRPRCDRLVWRRMARADGERLMAAPAPRPRLAEVEAAAGAEADLDLDLVRGAEAEEGRW
mmetsp:Transcript_2002/g.3367  ORF Transcript_2002/g.3367 Transcript_2002/m.3367 type:complete len:234 (+) Transcript_2002:242-943(+)